MRILFIGPYRQTDGWGEAAKDYIRALMLLDEHELVIKPVYMSRAVGDIPEGFESLENKRFDGTPDVVIQNVLPNMTTYVDGAININLSYFETKNLDHTLWSRALNMADHIWVSSWNEVHTLYESRWLDAKKVALIPMPLNMKSLDEEPTEFKLPASGFRFYFIGELIERKNIDALIMAFHREFDPNESVDLILKINRVGKTPEKTESLMRERIGILRKKMRLYRDINAYRSEIIITERLPHKAMLGLHKACDCFVMPSRGESLCRPLMDATYLGNQAITTYGTGMDDVAATAGTMSIESDPVPVLTSEPPLLNIYTSREIWREVSVLHLQQQMRRAVDDRTTSSKQIPNMREKFSYIGVANKMRGFFDDISS